MAQTRMWYCDGCGHKVETGVDEKNPLCEVKVTVGAWGKDFDLCVSCRDHLIERADPSKWVRAAKAA